MMEAPKTMNREVPDASFFRALEEALLDPAVRHSRERLTDLLADDFLEFGVSGRVHRKADVLEAAIRLPDVETPLGDFALERVASDVVLVTYRSVTRMTDGSALNALRSSVWVERDGSWQLRFHQGTAAHV